MTSKTLKELIKKKQEIEEEFRKSGETLVTAEIEKFFADNPKVTGVCWDQYAPYFNDGDPCVFGVNEFYATHLEEPGDPDSYGGWEDSDGEEQSDAASALNDLINDEDLLKIAFGDDNMIVCLRTEDGVKITTEQASHD